MRKLKHSQNFIRNKALVDQLIQKAGINRLDNVLEIGAGTGNITERLCRKAGKVIAIEKDRKLYDQTGRRLGQLKNLVLIGKDFFDCPLPYQPYKCFSNIPFNYTADIVRKLFLGSNPPSHAYLFMQKESVERFMGKPKTTQISLLLAPFWDIGILNRFRRIDFKPVPAVDVVFVKFARKYDPHITKKDYFLYRDFITYALNQWKKNVGKSLDRIFSYTQLKRLSKSLNINLKSKPSELTYNTWLGLFRFCQLKKEEVNIQTFIGYYEKLERFNSRKRREYRYWKI
ncbi:MAG: 23S ribosomal RNA methyltransferase Erm [Candidatus Dojkabacteria bacterium]|nr:23S ribosomal RNA methyltransferase Erm [Candidatus Dojkabacteria bacterium]